MDRNLKCRFNPIQTFQTIRMNSPEEFPLLGPKSSIEPFAGLQIDVDFPGVLEDLILNKQKISPAIFQINFHPRRSVLVLPRQLAVVHEIIDISLSLR